MQVGLYVDRYEGRTTWKDSTGNKHIAIMYEPSVYKLKNKHKYLIAAEITRWRSIRYRATKKNLDMNITVEDVKRIINLPCVYCGDSRKLSEVDRKDSQRGYTLDNVVPACRRCNTIKNNVVSYEEMKFIANYLGWGYNNAV